MMILLRDYIFCSAFPFHRRCKHGHNLDILAVSAVHESDVCHGESHDYELYHVILTTDCCPSLLSFSCVADGCIFLLDINHPMFGTFLLYSV